MQRTPWIPQLRISEMRDRPITSHGREITPIARVVQLNWARGAFLWQRPVAIEVRQGDSVRRLSISNATRLATTSIRLAGLALIVLAASWMRWKNSRNRSSSRER